METAVQTCYRHPDRRAGVICQRCDRPICPDCMNQASVGFHCPECTRSSGQKVVRGPLPRARPVVTHVLIALNVAIFGAGVGSGLRTRPEVIYDGGLIGVSGLTPSGVIHGVGDGDWWRIVTSGFLHANLIHIAMNCLVLYQLGHLLEPAVGRLRFATVYGVALLTGSFGVLLVTPDRLTVGASGAVFGLMGLAVALLRARGVNFFDTGLGGTIVLNLIITVTLPGISIGGHVGGLVGGFLAGWVLADVGPRHLKDPRATLGATIAIGAAAVVGCLVVA